MPIPDNQPLHEDLWNNHPFYIKHFNIIYIYMIRFITHDSVLINILI